MNKTNHHIYKAEQIDWEKLESVGISRSQIEKDNYGICCNWSRHVQN